MTKALVVIIFQGPPIRHEYYRLTWELMKLSLEKCGEQFDKIYIVCNSFNPTTEDLEWLRTHFKEKAVLMLAQMQSHWGCMNFVLKQVTEDAVLLIDSDTVIYNPMVVLGNFQLLENQADVVSIFDSSGEDLGFPVLGDQRRFAPYMCFMDMEVLRKTSMNFDPDSTHDSMGLLTKELLEKGARAKQIPDDRGTVYIDGTIYPSIKPEPGYYHLRNWNGALHILTSWLNDRESYDRDVKLMPLNERARLLTWAEIINELTGYSRDVTKAVDEIFKDWGIPKWRDYMLQVVGYHEWLRGL